MAGLNLFRRSQRLSRALQVPKTRFMTKFKPSDSDDFATVATSAIVARPAQHYTRVLKTRQCRFKLSGPGFCLKTSSPFLLKDLLCSRGSLLCLETTGGFLFKGPGQYFSTGAITTWQTDQKGVSVGRIIKLTCRNAAHVWSSPHSRHPRSPQPICGPSTNACPGAGPRPSAQHDAPQSPAREPSR